MDGSGIARVLTAFALLGLAAAALAAVAARAGALQRLAPFARGLAALAAAAFALAGLAVLGGAGGGVLAWWPGFPGDPWRLGLDALSAPFAVLVGISGAATLLAHAPATRGRLALHALFVGATAAVVCARHALLLLVAWEFMTLASAALVAADPASARARRATFLYLVLSQAGAAALAAAVLAAGARAGTLQLEPLLAALVADPAAPAWIALVTLAAAIKLGLVPLHAWLPLAHPEAPGPTSAFMSGAMVTMGLYLLLRAVWWPLGTPPAAWGGALVVLGVVSAIAGALSAVLDTDAKRLLAWSTVKHSGVLALGIGLAATLAARGAAVLAGVALVAVLYHAIGHGLAKTLAFLAVGDAAHATGTRDLEQWGGLWRPLPRATFAAFVAATALAGSPLLPLFASEWLIFQVILLAQRTGGPAEAMQILVPFSGAGLALAGALALAAMVKLVGIGFLGRARDPARTPAPGHDAGAPAVFALVGFALAWGVLAPSAMVLLAPAVRSLLPGFEPGCVAATGGLALVPGSAEAASVSPLALAVLLLLFAAQVALWLRPGRTAIRHAPSWSCGAPLAPRQQYSALGLSQPVRRVFASVVVPDDPAHAAPGRRAVLGQRALYESIAMSVLWASGRVRGLQSGRLEVYLATLLATLVALLLWGRG